MKNIFEVCIRRENFMNAIILAAGESSRMYQTGGKTHKALLPIQNIPNIERIILMLHCLNITDIIVAVPYNCSLFDYLKKKYLCKIVNIKKQCRNTLYTLNELLHYLNDTFIIEGDVVLSKNVFDTFDKSTYYVTEYLNPESDDWHPIKNSEGYISSFQISKERKDAIFGISFWTVYDCPFLISYLQEQSSKYNIQNSDIFWDDNIVDILDKIKVNTYKISNENACEMNTYDEYEHAIEICEKSLDNWYSFFNNVSFRTDITDTCYKINCCQDRRKNIEWLTHLFFYYGDMIESENNFNYDEYFASDELICIVSIKYTENEIAFFSLVQEHKFIILRRLYINPDYRYKHIGTQIIHYIKLYCLFKEKELRVNIYDDNAELFYKSLGFKKLYKTYVI